MSEQAEASISKRQDGVSLSIDAATRINSAFHQNQVPTISGIEFQNDTAGDLSDVTVEITVTPAFLEPKRFTFDRVKAGGLQRLSPVPVALDPKVLLSVSERVRGEILVTATAEGVEVARVTHSCELLSPHEWTGVASAPELIACFVRPNDPAIDVILRRAATKLERAGRSNALDGYRSGGKSRVWELAEAIWAALSDEAIVYALPPASFETDGQKVRSPSAILERKVGTCLDLTLLLAACYEQAGLNPIVIFSKGHALVGLWLVEHEFAQAIVDEPQVLRKRRDLDDLILVETTILTSRQRFATAVEQGRVQVDEDATKPFELAVDIRRARMRRIQPLSLGDDTSPSVAKVEVSAPIEMELSAVPVFIDEVRIDETTDANLSRLEKWQRKLLDLSLRNKLLNFKPGKGSVTLVCPDPGALEDKLAQGEKLCIRAKAAVMEGGDPRSADLQLRVIGEDAARAYARDSVLRGDVHADLEANELDDRLTELFRAARNAMEEGGANSLHLALGFVRWSPTDRKGGHYRAPLILLPVALERRSVRSGFKLVRHDDDARINPTLLQMLRQDFGIAIPEFDRPDLPMDSSGLDVARIWSIARKHLVDAKGFEVTEEVVLSTFSFAKYLMWKDLVDRSEVLKRNPVVAHLIDTPTAAYGDGGGLPEERDLDREVAAKDLLTPLPADSSQIAAVVAASRGKDFVLFGPPGTGKSQTIANLITHLLGEGKTVLFVSQKTTALEVVRQRLDRLGLGGFCLEVHSAKAQKSAVLGQLQQAWQGRSGEAALRWAEKADEVDQLRDQLNGLVEALHRHRRNGLTAYRALGQVVAGRAWRPDLRLSFPSADYHDEAAMRRLRDLCAQLRLALANVGDPATHPLRLIRQTEWSPGWRTDLAAAVAAFTAAAHTFQRACEPVASLFGTRLPGEPQSVLELITFGTQALKPEARSAITLLHADTDELRRRLSNLTADRSAAQQAIGRIGCSYRDGIYALDFGKLIFEWRAAEASNFVFRGGRKKKVWQALTPFTDAEAPDDVGVELTALLDAAAARSKLMQHDTNMEGFGALWRGIETDPAQLAAALDWVETTRTAASACGREGRDARAWLDMLSKLIVERRDDLGQGGPVQIALTGLLAAHKSLQEQRAVVARLAATDVHLGIEDEEDWLEHALAAVAGWPPALHRSQSWCAWQRASQQASLDGLEPLMTAVQQGLIRADELSFAFELSYARWWVDRVIDTEKPLREFIASFHEDAIARFAKLDEELANLSRKVVASRLSNQIPPRNAFGTDPEWGTLSRELAKKARHMPLRQLFGQMPNALTTLAPCMMMSPLSIAQFLPAEAKPFDVVIFDEASQMPVWDAVGAIARGTQVIVVGDPKQLPPTTFFDRSADDMDDAAEIEDLESILDECLAANIPHKRLSWHYRSRHESLIAFSNERYYEGQLVTFPSPVTDDRAVRYVNVPDGAYERGGGRVNRSEARVLVADVVRRLRHPRFAAENASLGIVTFNSEQQKLIENLLDQERRASPEIERFFGPDWHEPVFVKNLESVQGDERDVILFSVAYGPDATGHMTQNYGPLNLDGGTRRLNVGVTRARTELVVFATLRPEQIDLSRAKGAGVRDFKHFLEFAQRGHRALTEAAAPLGRDEDSGFERAVRSALEAKGWTIHPQVGVSSFRIDLGIVHPDAPGRYLSAVECDGATYHRSATARDRDRLREAVLRKLGWRVRRVWSTDWWNDADRALEELHARLEEDLAEQRQQDADAAAAQETATATELAPETGEPDPAPGSETLTVLREPEAMDTDFALEEPQRHYADLPSTPIVAADGGALGQYRIADLAAAGFAPKADRFYDPTYRPILRQMATHVITMEGPIFDDLLVRRIARFHGFQRTGQQIRETVVNVIDGSFPRTAEGDRKVFWPEGSARTMETCRLGGSDVRDHSDIPEAELVALARRHLSMGTTIAEAVVGMAADLDLGRLRQSTRQRFENIARLACESVRSSDSTVG
jgi:very-short-patch-repair endonuclease/DNA polymerase III delta prime subunit